MPGLFSRLKTWVANEVLVYSDLNAEFDNIISNLEADTLGGYSATVAQMRSQVNPGSVGSESQPSSISGELERIRFVISRIVGKTYWYDTPARSLQSFTLDYRHVFSPQLDTTVLEAAGEAVDAGILDDISGVGLAVAYDSTFKGSTGKFSAYSLRNAPTTGAHLYRLDSGRLQANSNTYSFWFKNVASGDTLFENQLLGLRVYLNVSGFIQLDFTEYSVSGTLKNVRSITGSTTLAGSANWNSVYFSYSIQNSAATDAICLYVNGSLIGKISSIALKANKLDSSNSTSFLFASEKNSSVTEQITQNNNVVPSSNGWTVTGTGSEALSDGILSVTTPSGATRYYSNSTGIGSPAGTIPAAGVYFETKFRLTSGGSTLNANPTSRQGHLTFIFRSDTSNLAASIIITGGSIAVGGASGITTTNTVIGDLYEAPWDFSQWTKLTCTFESGGVTNVYLNGKYILSGVMETDATAGNLLAFGKFENASEACTFEMEYIRAGSGQLIPRQNGVLTQEISDLVAFRGYQEDPALISGLQLSSPLALFGAERNTKVTEGDNINFIARKTITGTTNAFLIGAVRLYSNGRNLTYYSAVASAQTFNFGTTSANIALFGIISVGSSRPFDSLRAPNNNDATAIAGPAGVSSNFWNNGVATAIVIPPSPVINSARLLPPGRVIIRFYIKNTQGGNPLISQGQFLGFQV